MGTRRGRGVGRIAIAGLLALIGSALTACLGSPLGPGVPDRSREASVIADELRALPGVRSVDGRYSHEPVMGYSFHVDVRLAIDATSEQVAAVADRFHAGLTGSDFSRHTSRFVAQWDNDVIRVFADDAHRVSPSAEVERWYRLVHDVPGAVEWAVHADPAKGPRSIGVELDRPSRDGDPAQLTGLVRLLGERASDLADRQWIVRWRKLRLDLMGPTYPDAPTVALIAALATTGQWSAIHQPSATPTLKLAVWATAPDRMEATARSDLPRIRALGVPVSYTVRANSTEPIEVLAGGCLPGGSDLQQRLNREFGTC